MIKSVAALIAANTLAATVGLTGASARVPILEKKFSNCAALNKVYPGGVAKASSSVNKGGATKLAPVVNAKVYKENSGKDRDNDGIACEK